jgi:hypothetical protein
MNEATRNQLEVKLKKMLDDLDQAKTKPKQPILQTGVGNIIRRRAGQKEKRFSISYNPYGMARRRKNEA